MQNSISTKTWLLPNTFSTDPFNFFNFLNVFVQLTWFKLLRKEFQPFLADHVIEVLFLLWIQVRNKWLAGSTLTVAIIITKAFLVTVKKVPSPVSTNTTNLLPKAWTHFGNVQGFVKLGQKDLSFSIHTGSRTVADTSEEVFTTVNFQAWKYRSTTLWTGSTPILSREPWFWWCSTHVH